VEHPKVIDPERFVMELMGPDGAIREDVALCVEELARKSNAGMLTHEEYEEYAQLVRMNDKLMELRRESEEFWQFLEKSSGMLPPGSIDDP